MLEEILEAIEQKNYQTAEELIQKLSSQDSENLWVKYCYAYLEENKNNLEQALAKYRKILQDLVFPDAKLIAQIRNRIERINQLKKEEKQKEEKQKQQEVNQFKSIPNSTELAVLILEPIEIIEKKEAAKKMAKIMAIDVYSANLQIPTRNWRLFRCGNLGELTYYETELKKASIPCFCIAIKEINKINIYQVKHIKSTSPELILSCKNNLEEDETITINYSEISNRVEGLLPLFDSSVHLDNKGTIMRKNQTFDYAKFYDIHYPNKNIILRFSDYNYEFEQDINFTIKEKTTNSKWNNLCGFFNQKMSKISLYSDFTIFGQAVIDFPEMLKQIQSHVKLCRREETPWDAAFQLYSGLIFLKINLKL